jgi:CO dehydrogenase/acetyl-CoA synthase beta subunit
LTVFDAYILKIAEYVEDMRAQGRRIAVFNVPASVKQLKEGLPVRVGPNANPGIILREDTYVELGNPEVGSCAFILFTDKPELVNDGRITVIGPDIKDSDNKSLPFGQVLLMGGTELGGREHEELKYLGFVGDQIEGYMVRSYTRSIWSRVSKDAAAKGFCLESLGRALMSIYKSGNTKIESMEALFVTSGRGDIKELDDIATQVQKITREIVRETWKIRGYDIDCANDCSSCSDKPVCDDIREVLRAKEKNEQKGEESYNV